MDYLKLQKSLQGNMFGRSFLWILSKVYAFAIFLNEFAYHQNWRKSYELNSRVVCIGNITTGGTGKTTTIMFAAKKLSEKGVRVSVVSRGYKRHAKKNEVVVLLDQKSRAWHKAGDEPYMISEVLSEHKVPVVVSEDRYSACCTALRKFRSQIVLLDDGLQHHRLKRNTNIVLLDARMKSEDWHLLPLGNLRESVKGLNRADLILITHANQSGARKLEDIKDKVREINDELEILEAEHEPTFYFDIFTSKKLPLKNIKGDVAVFSAIGEPESFEQTLKDLDLNLKQVWRFPDHQEYTEHNLRSLLDLRQDLPLITTYKDFVKFPPHWREILQEKVYILFVDLKVRGGKKEESKFLDTIYPGFSKI